MDGGSTSTATVAGSDGGQSSSGAAGPGPSSALAAQAARFRALQPKRWQRLSSQVDGKPYELPTSGAHISLTDLINATEARLAATAAEDQVDTDIDAEYTPEQRVAGWIGTPDPAKYAPGTNYLSPEELEAEKRAGNIVACNDWITVLQSLEPWRIKLLQDWFEVDYAHNRVFVDVPADEVGPGGRVSFWDLYQYVHHNPELAALLERQRGIEDGGTGGQLAAEDLMPLRGAPSDPNSVALSDRQFKQLPWVCVGSGKLWRLRPTKWLKGLDGRLDFDFGVFAHEAQAQQLLGPGWAGRPAKEVLGDETYWADVRQAGPRMGMTYLVAAARDLPIQDAAKTWAGLLRARMLARGVAPAVADQTLTNLADLVEPGRLVAETRLATATGSHIRAGSTLMLTTLPQGRVLLQAMAPDPVKSREYYLLGALYGCEELVGAMASLALGGGSPAEAPVDEGMVRPTGMRLLLAANGYRVGDREGSGPNVSVEGGGAPPARHPPRPKPTMFRLPPVGQPAPDVAGARGVLGGVEEEVVMQQLRAAFAEAERAADVASAGVPQSQWTEETVDARRAAAMAALAAGLKTMGLEGLVQGAARAAPPGLLSAAVPLASVTQR